MNNLQLSILLIVSAILIIQILKMCGVIGGCKESFGKTCQNNSDCGNDEYCVGGVCKPLAEAGVFTGGGDTSSGWSGIGG